MATTTDMTDASVITRSRTHPAAFAELFDKYATRIARYAAAKVRACDVQDVVSDTFCIAFDKRDTFDTTYRSALPWLFGIAHNVVRNHTRRAHRAVPVGTDTLSALDTAQDPTDDTITRLDAKRDIHTIRAALRTLPDTDAEPLILYAVANLSYSQIADTLDLPKGTVKSRINRARKTLETALTAGPTTTTTGHVRTQA